MTIRNKQSPTLIREYIKLLYQNMYNSSFGLELNLLFKKGLRMFRNTAMILIRRWATLEDLMHGCPV